MAFIKTGINKDRLSQVSDKGNDLIYKELRDFMNRTEKKLKVLSSILGVNEKALENILNAPSLDGDVGALTNQLSGLQTNIDALPYFSIPTSDTARPNGQVKVYDSGSIDIAPESGKTIKFTLPWRNLTSHAQFWGKVDKAGEVDNHWINFTNIVGWYDTTTNSSGQQSIPYSVTMNYENFADGGEGHYIYVEIPYSGNGEAFAQKYGNSTASPEQIKITDCDRVRLIVVEYGEVSNQNVGGDPTMY